MLQLREGLMKCVCFLVEANYSLLGNVHVWLSAQYQLPLFCFLEYVVRLLGADLFPLSHPDTEGILVSRRVPK